MTRDLCLARMEGFEPPTAWFVGRYSIQLSYMRVTLSTSILLASPTSRYSIIRLVVRLTPSGCLEQFKIAPGDFVFALVVRLTPSGCLEQFKIAPGDFVFALVVRLTPSGPDLSVCSNLFPTTMSAELHVRNSFHFNKVRQISVIGLRNQALKIIKTNTTNYSHLNDMKSVCLNLIKWRRRRDSNPR